MHSISMFVDHVYSIHTTGLHVIHWIIVIFIADHDLQNILYYKIICVYSNKRIERFYWTKTSKYTYQQLNRLTNVYILFSIQFLRIDMKNQLERTHHLVAINISIRSEFCHGRHNLRVCIFFIKLNFLTWGVCSAICFKNNCFATFIFNYFSYFCLICRYKRKSFSNLSCRINYCDLSLSVLSKVWWSKTVCLVDWKYINFIYILLHIMCSRQLSQSS